MQTGSDLSRGEYLCDCHAREFIIEGFGEKRVLGILLKTELCQKPSKFRMQLCLGALNNVLYVFLLKFASFSKYCVCKKPVFVVTSACDCKDGNIISLKIQQNIDLSQHVTLKMVISTENR